MKRYLLIVALFFSAYIYAQNNTIIEQKNDGFSKIMLLKVDYSLIIYNNGGYGLKMATPMEVTSFAVGWLSSTFNYKAGNFYIKYRMHKAAKGWSQWRSDDCLINPDQNPQNIYKSDLLFGIDEFLHDSVEFYLFPPQGETINQVFLFLQDISAYLGKNHSNKPISFDSKTCPEFPAMITRTSWCGANTNCSNPTYTVTYRPNMTHAIIHHGASPTSYTDGAAVVYSYWNYHVNSNGWSDIGYNYLFDKYGNFFQGRHNPQLPTNDVNAAHAGASNPYSIGCNFLGDSDSPGTAPTILQINKCEELLAWWFNNKNLDPTSYAQIVRQIDATWATLPRICGHKDSYIGGTACPGNALYDILPQIRQETLSKINACGDTTKPSTTIITQKNWQNNDFQINFNDIDYDNAGNIISNNLAFYQFEYNEMNNWKTDPNYGFLKENFNVSNPDWIIESGNWQFNNGTININSTTTNTNIYTNLIQDNNSVYLYSWDMKFNASGSNTRAGIHFFCSDPSETNRGNSFMIYFREHNDKVQIYRYGTGANNEDIYVYATNDDTEVTAGVWYNIKVIYNPTTGKVDVFKNDLLVSTYTFSDFQYTNANAISLRAGEANVSFDNFIVYKSRQQSVFATVGANNVFPYESINQFVSTAKINTILLDYSNNWSNIISQDFFIDTTDPNIIPISFDESWKISNFQFDFNDIDSLSGINNSYYLIKCYDGINWRANGQSGFAFESFDSMNNWNIPNNSGNWTISNGIFVNSDETVSNSQTYSLVNQNDDEFIYSFDLRIEGSGNNRRAGLHYFSDDTTINRGNGYFIFFRFPNNNLEFYKVTNDVFSLEKTVSVTMTPDLWNNIKINFSRITGKSAVFINDVFIADWTDINPIQNGDYVSFRSGNSMMSIDNFKIYKNRTNNINILLGNDNDVFIENLNPSTNSTILETFTKDNAENESSISYFPFNVDWTAPENIEELNANVQIISEEEFIFNIIGSFSPSIDSNSDIKKYWISIGTDSLINDIIDWTDNGLDTNFIFQHLQDTNTYYVNVKAENGAGLFSEIKYIKLLNPFETSINNITLKNELSIFPNPNNGNFVLNFGEINGKYLLSIFDTKGNKIIEKNIDIQKNIKQEFNFNLAKGIYYLKIDGNSLKFIVK